jgi:hypothetical protein
MELLFCQREKRGNKMKYEDLIRKIFKNYKSKRELRQELKELASEPPKVIYKEQKLDLVTLKCTRLVDPYELHHLGSEAERDLAYGRIRHDMEREMFDYLINSKAIKFYSEFDNYEFKEKLTGFMQVAR